jgi:hypothetical protein
MGDVANKDEAFKCLDIARAALKEGEHARAEKFAAKALRLYRCSQVCAVTGLLSRGGGSCVLTWEVQTGNAKGLAASSGSRIVQVSRPGCVGVGGSQGCFRRLYRS